MRHEATVLGLDPTTGVRLPPGALAALRGALGKEFAAAAE
jgi:hypothetical protein